MSAQTTSRALLLSRPTLLLRTAIPKRAFSSTRPAQGGGIQYDPPTGWLFGRKPGEKRVKEGWENVFYFGYVGSFVVACIAYAFKPDTRYVWFLGHWKCDSVKMALTCRAEANPRTAYKPGRLRKPADDWKPRVSSPTQTPSPRRRRNDAETGSQWRVLP